MNLNKIDNIYFIGIGGIGMSAIARWFTLQGKNVAGYDRTKTPLSAQLESEGMLIHYEDDVNLIPKSFLDANNSLIVYTPAIPKDHKEYNYLSENGFEIRKRSEVLGKISRNKFTIAVAGTHGKTTTSSMIAHILKQSGHDMVAFLGGLSANYKTNFIYHNPASKDAVVVAEADEFDRSFLQLKPDIAVITSADADHLDIYGDKMAMEESFREFVGKIAKDGILFVNHKIAAKFKVPEGIMKKTYSRLDGDLKSEGLRIKGGNFIFDYHNGLGTIRDLALSVPGFHNVENLIAAVGVCLKLGLSREEISAAVKTYTGVKRRFEYILKSEKIIFVDDYAHHPIEIEAFLKSMKSLYPGKKITVAFQPHLYSRTRDFAVEFAESLSLADKVLLLDIYPARELPLTGVTSEIIFDRITAKEKILCKRKELIGKLMSDKDLEVLATMGAGDIDQLVDPLKDMLIKKYELER
jgi:UDP-N-acetylmuramate--alanine ligase